MNSYEQASVVSNLNEKEYNMEDYYFGRPEKNEYTNEELYNMEIQEIIFGIHPTFYGERNGKIFSSIFLFKII